MLPHGAITPPGHVGEPGHVLCALVVRSRRRRAFFRGKRTGGDLPLLRGQTFIAALLVGLHSGSLLGLSGPVCCLWWNSVRLLVVLALSAHGFHIHHACILVPLLTIPLPRYIKTSFQSISTRYPAFGVCEKDRKSRGGDEDDDMKGRSGRKGGAICLVQRSSVAQRGAQSDTGESHHVTAAATAEDDGGPIALHFMWNHVPAKASLLIPSTTLRKIDTLLGKCLIFISLCVHLFIYLFI